MSRCTSRHFADTMDALVSTKLRSSQISQKMAFIIRHLVLQNFVTAKRRFTTGNTNSNLHYAAKNLRVHLQKRRVFSVTKSILQRQNYVSLSLSFFVAKAICDVYASSVLCFSSSTENCRCKNEKLFLSLQNCIPFLQFCQGRPATTGTRYMFAAANLCL